MLERWQPFWCKIIQAWAWPSACFGQVTSGVDQKLDTDVFMGEDGDLDQGWAVKVYSDRHGRWEGVVVLSDRAWLSLVVGRRQGLQGWL